jgi:hypothetical protein
MTMTQPYPTQQYAPVQYVPPVQRKRGLRAMSWVILAVQVLFLIWMITGLSSHGASCGSLSSSACASATDVGKGIAAVLVLAIWVCVDVVLGVIWLVTRPRQW